MTNRCGDMPTPLPGGSNARRINKCCYPPRTSEGTTEGGQPLQTQDVASGAITSPLDGRT
eukprot:12906793-Heterocapsa_arctica.AAC.1